MLTKEQIEGIKKQLIQSIKKDFQEDKKEFAIKQIKNMSSEELEEFLRKNNLKASEFYTETENCIFCSIVNGKINSYKIDENEQAIAVLEINPLSKGHVLIIPKEHLLIAENVPKVVFDFTKEIVEKIKNKLKPKNVEISPVNILGHEIINLVPVYEEEKPEKRQQAKPEELIELQKKFAKKEKIIREKKLKKVENKTPEKIWLPKRIP